MYFLDQEIKPGKYKDKNNHVSTQEKKLVNHRREVDKGKLTP